MYQRFKQLYLKFININPEDSDEIRKRKILNILCIGFFIVALVLHIAAIIFIFVGVPYYTLFYASAFFLVFIICIVFLNNKLSQKASSVLLICILTVLFFLTDEPIKVVDGRGLLLFAVPILMASILLSPLWGIIIAIIISIAISIILVILGLFPDLVSTGVLMLIALISYISANSIEKALNNVRKGEKLYQDAYNRANLYKDLFAHDMSNILQNILSYQEFASRYQDIPEKEKEFKEMLSLMNKQIKRGSNLILNIRKLSELEEIQIPLKRIDIKSILKNTVDSIEDIYSEKEIKIELNPIKDPTYIQANELLIDLFQNIISNAILHNKKSSIEMTINLLSIVKDNKSHIKIEFIDNGVGIPDEIKQSIFERSVDRDRSKKGMGLGLSIVKKILSLINGEIWVEDKIPGDHTKGSKFVILIPKSKNLQID